MSWENNQAAYADQHAYDTHDDQQNRQANTMMYNILSWSTIGLSHEQLLAYYNATANFFYSNDMQSPLAHQHTIDSRLNPHPLLVNLPSIHELHGLRQHVQSIMASTNIPHSMQRTTSIHFNTDQYKPTMIMLPLRGSNTLRPTSSMANPASTSTPAKRNRCDVRNNSDTSTHYQKRTRVFNSNNTPVKRLQQHVVSSPRTTRFHPFLSFSWRKRAIKRWWKI